MVQEMNINLGCGRHRLEGYLNIDSKCDKDNNPDIIWNLERGLSIIPSNYAEAIWANMVLEHIVAYIDLMREAHRVLKNGGKFSINVPDSNGSNAWGHPEHVRGFNMTSFRYFEKGTDEYKAYSPDFEFKTEKYETTGEVISVILVAVKE